MSRKEFPWRRVAKYGALFTGFMFVALNIDWVMGSIIQLGLHPLLSAVSLILFVIFVAFGIVKWKALKNFIHG